MLLAPLAKEAGGWGLCSAQGGAGSPLPAANAANGSRANGDSSDGARGVTRPTNAIFASSTDPGYQAILAMISAGRDFLEQNKRFDMAGFVPRTDWFREMKRYGMVPQCVRPEEATDVYAIEQDYWRSLWHQPPAAPAH